MKVLCWQNSCLNCLSIKWFLINTNLKVQSLHLWLFYITRWSRWFIWGNLSVKLISYSHLLLFPHGHWWKLISEQWNQSSSLSSTLVPHRFHIKPAGCLAWQGPAVVYRTHTCPWNQRKLKIPVAPHKAELSLLPETIANCCHKIH